MRNDKCVIFTLAITYMIPSVTMYSITTLDRELYLKNFSLCLGILISCRVLKMMVDVFMGLQFLTLLGYFIYKKTSSLLMKGKKLTSFNKKMIFLTYLNFTLKSVNAFCVVTVLTIWQYK